MGTRIHRGLAHAVEQILIIIVNPLTKEEFVFRCDLNRGDAIDLCEKLNKQAGDSGWRFYVK